jgi:hypothetical protein
MSDVTLYVAIVTALTSVVSTAIPLAFAWIRESRRSQFSADKLGDSSKLEIRLTELSNSMRSSASLVAQISAELEARAATVKKLQEEAASAETLASINKEQAQAVQRLLGAELQGSERRTHRRSLIDGALYFIGGAAASFLITLLVHPL